MVHNLLFTPDLVVNLLSLSMETIFESGQGSILHKMTTHHELIWYLGTPWPQGAVLFTYLFLGNER